jgi:phosphoketolase
MIKDLQDFMEQFEDTVVVNILEDNKYEIDTFTMIGSDLIEDMIDKKVSFNGFGSNEFYIIRNDTEYTIQVSNFKLDTSCEF